MTDDGWDPVADVMNTEAWPYFAGHHAVTGDELTLTVEKDSPYDHVPRICGSCPICGGHDFRVVKGSTTLSAAQCLGCFSWYRDKASSILRMFGGV